MRKLIVALAALVALSTPVLASVGDIGTIGGTTYIVIGVSDIGGGDFVVTLASDKNGVQSMLMEQL